jgi:hypothetical protein
MLPRRKCEKNIRKITRPTAEKQPHS